MWFDKNGTKIPTAPPWVEATERLDPGVAVRPVIIGMGTPAPARHAPSLPPDQGLSDPGAPAGDAPPEPDLETRCEPEPPTPDVEATAQPPQPDGPAAPAPDPPEPDPLVQQQLGLLTTAINELANARTKAAQRDMRFCAELALAVAQELVAVTFDLAPETLAELISRSVALVGAEAPILVRIHPQLLAALEAADALADLRADGVTIAPDPQVDPVGCVVETPTRSVDAQVKPRLAQVRRALEEALGESLHD